MKRTCLLLFAALCVAAFVSACGSEGSDPAGTSASQGVVAPPDAIAGEAERVPVTFVGIDGIHAALASRRSAGRAVLLNFWATWCAPCVEELPDLAAVSRESIDRGPDVIGVSLDAWVIGDDSEVEARIRKALAQAGVAYPILVYKGDQDPLMEAFGLPGPIPHSILYDAEGKPILTWSEKVEIDALRGAIAGMRR